ncbi:MAG TPA: DNA repair protein RadA [Elusimicrobia bacterium]|nr:MAG: DNA repair protein RadA [Elusimicrobia bacterium GWA2_64_40]OGR67998.1 MAG: DNA repair protein RadA [Elusimicrobia bacterium GWB2_63_16]HAN05454.1 DNA repair protein RadA [Elusimicrobiota bacterium]HAU90522.1 DNA repair protein RadA [Elusimicrobiota bacterium]
MKLKTIYRCQECGQASPKWAGKCPGCGGWNTLVEEAEEVLTRAAAKARGLTDFSEPAVKLSEARAMKCEHASTGITELDRALGGGLVKGQVVLLAGPPGIGKSTLTLESCTALAAGAFSAGKILYVSGEESLAQVGSRAERLGAKPDNVYLMSETNLAKIIEEFRKLKPAFLVIDSIQTVYHPEFVGSPGSVGQIRECASELLKIAKGAGTPLFLLGHVTKEGSLAGPKVLEHIVDTVLYFDAEKSNVFRVLRPHKNRFGPVDETGIFEMTSRGLRPVDDAGLLLAEADRDRALAGRGFAVAFEGARPMLAEIQALAGKSYLPYPRRTVTGMDLNRAQMLIAALEKNLGLRFDEMDVFASLQGGIKLRDTALDLAFCAALISSAKDIALPPDCVFIGEVGILGQTASPGFMDRRLAEAERLGFTRAFVPRQPKKDEGRYKTLRTEVVRDIGALYSALAGLTPAKAGK